MAVTWFRVIGRNFLAGLFSWENKKQNPQIFSYDPLSRTELQKKNQMHIKKKKTPISERFEKPQLLLKDSHVF